MKSLAKLFRLIQINFILAKYGLDNVILSTRWFAPIHFLVYLNPLNLFRRGQYPRGVAIRHALEDLGPIFVKFGQALSTRRDLLPDDIADALAQLQDKVAPFDPGIAKRIVEKHYQQPITTLFAEFAEQPLASASIAQVHAAELVDGEKVVVKILRPNMKKIIQRDISLMYTIANILERYWQDSARLKPKAIVAEFERNILSELNLLQEAANASQLKRNFKNSAKLYVPKIYWPYAKEKIIVMERIYGIPIADVERLKASGFDLQKLAQLAVDIFFTQVFHDNFFHADMHPGNIFIHETRLKNPQLIAVDFGLMGSLTEQDKRYLAENLLAFFNQDYRKVALLHLESGWLSADTNINEFEAAIRTVSEPIFERPLKDISFAQLMGQLIQCAQQFNMEVQPQLISLQKNLFAIEGLVRQLYPDFDLWNTVKPFLEQAIKEQISPKTFIKKIRANTRFWVEQLPDLPILFHDVLTQIKQKQFTLEVKPLTTSIAVKPGRRFRRGFMYGIGATFVLIASVNLFSRFANVFEVINTENVSISFAIAGALILLVTWLNK